VGLDTHALLVVPLITHVAAHHDLLTFLLFQVQQEELRHLMFHHAFQDVPVGDLRFTALTTNAVGLVVDVKCLQLLRILTETQQKLLVMLLNLLGCIYLTCSSLNFLLHQCSPTIEFGSFVGWFLDLAFQV
jgi:hypothetical protein